VVTRVVKLDGRGIDNLLFAFKVARFFFGRASEQKRVLLLIVSGDSERVELKEQAGVRFAIVWLHYCSMGVRRAYIAGTLIFNCRNLLEMRSELELGF